MPEPIKFNKIPQAVEAYQITRDNILEVAEWCGAVVSTDKGLAILLNTRLGFRAKGYVGDYVFRNVGDDQFRILDHILFEKDFERTIDARKAN